MKAQLEYKSMSYASNEVINPAHPRVLTGQRIDPESNKKSILFGGLLLSFCQDAAPQLKRFKAAVNGRRLKLAILMQCHLKIEDILHERTESQCWIVNEAISKHTEICVLGYITSHVEIVG